MENAKITHLERVRAHLSKAQIYNKTNVINLGEKVVKILNGDFQKKLRQAKELAEQAQSLSENLPQTLPAEWDLSEALKENEKIKRREIIKIIK